MKIKIEFANLPLSLFLVLVSIALFAVAGFAFFKLPYRGDYQTGQTKVVLDSVFEGDTVTLVGSEAKLSAFAWCDFYLIQGNGTNPSIGAGYSRFVEISEASGKYEVQGCSYVDITLESIASGLINVDLQRSGKSREQNFVIYFMVLLLNIVSYVILMYGLKVLIPEKEEKEAQEEPTPET